MISDIEKFQGFVFSKLINGSDKELIIRKYSKDNNYSFVVNGKGFYIKYSAKRISPWRFSFWKEHQDYIFEMKKSLGEVYVLLVCCVDGIVCLNFDELKNVLNNEHGLSEWVSVSRRHNQEYRIKGTDGALKYTVPVNSFPKKFIAN